MYKCKETTDDSLLLSGPGDKMFIYKSPIFPKMLSFEFSGITSFGFNKKHKSHFCSDVSFCKEGKEKSKVLWEDLTFKGILQDLKLPSDNCLCKNYKTF